MKGPGGTWEAHHVLSSSVVAVRYLVPWSNGAWNWKEIGNRLRVLKWGRYLENRVDISTPLPSLKANEVVPSNRWKVVLVPSETGDALTIKDSWWPANALILHPFIFLNYWRQVHSFYALLSFWTIEDKWPANAFILCPFVFLNYWRQVAHRFYCR